MQVNQYTQHQGSGTGKWNSDMIDVLNCGTPVVKKRREGAYFFMAMLNEANSMQ